MSVSKALPSTVAIPVKLDPASAAYDAEANKRLLLFEVLLDEYETLAQPTLFDRDDEELNNECGNISDPKQREQWKNHRLSLYRVLKARYEDPLHAGYFSSMPSETANVNLQSFKEDLESIKAYVKQHNTEPSEKYKAESEECESESYKLRLESRIDEELVGELYRLMYSAQKRAINREMGNARERAERLMAESDLEGMQRDEMIDRIAMLYISGDLDKMEARLKELYRSDSDQKEYEELIRKKLLREISHEDSGDVSLGHAGENKSGNGAGRGGDNRTPEQINAQALRSALCLSGGGIRSATFNLGIIQALARHGLLEKFDYLSTVSGGGFIGGWLSALIHRRPGGLAEVVKELSRPQQQSQQPLKPDPLSVEHLRIYGNFLSPQPGLLSADTWTLISSLLRNLVMTWLVFVPVLVALLMLPRIWFAIVEHSPNYIPNCPMLGLLVPLALGIWAFSYTGLALPTADEQPAFSGLGLSKGLLRRSEWNEEKRHKWGKGWRLKWRRAWRRWNIIRRVLNAMFRGFGLLDDWAGWKRWREKQGGQGRFLVFCLLPLVVAAASASVYCWINRKRGLSLWYFIFFMAAIILVPWIISACKIYANARPRTWKDEGKLLAKLIGATLVMLIAGYVTGYVLWHAGPSIMRVANDGGALLYATFALPLFVVFIGLVSMLIAGFTSRFTEDADQEWWARAGAWLLITVLVWIAAHLLVIYGPIMLIEVGAFIREALSPNFKFKSADAINLLGTALGIISGVVTLLGGFSASTPANEKEAKRAGLGGILLNILTSLLAPIFLIFILIMFALGTNWLLAGLEPLLKYNLLGLDGMSLPAASEHEALLQATPLSYLVVVALLILIASAVFGRLINTNAFSLHYMWRDRIIRAYLGASRRHRRPNLFTGFDPEDNVQMHQLRKQPTARLGPQDEFKNVSDEEQQSLNQNRSGKLLHIINVALNLTGGDKLAWQDRKAESLTISPLHVGSYWLGYRRSWKYGNYGAREGISLGTAVAISGAFVSPNMGYMMTSPVVRFLMTLFNVRFGWWLGNPGRAGDETYILERPLKWFEKIFIGDRPDFNLRSPRLSVLPIIEEAFGHTNDKSPYVYLSDGGHFENLGLYEMVLRRCRFIVVCDASTDAEYSFDSLAMSVRQIRVDLGVPIDIDELSITPPSQNLKNKYCAVGRIRYSCVDRDPHNPDASDGDYDGVLVYIKPALIGGEPRDVTTYGQDNASFPQETIVDQWFSEAQFESYRALASHIIHAICGGDNNIVNFPELERNAEEHTRLNFSAYREEIQYAAFQELFKGNMATVSPSSFMNRAKKYMEKLLK